MGIINQRNTNETAAFIGGTANVTTADLVFAANPDRLQVYFTTNSAQNIWLRFKTTGSDNVKEGMLCFGNTTTAIFPDGQNIYTGEISLIADSGTPAWEAMEI